MFGSVAINMPVVLLPSAEVPAPRFKYHPLRLCKDFLAWPFRDQYQEIIQGKEGLSLGKIESNNRSISKKVLLTALKVVLWATIILPALAAFGALIFTLNNPIKGDWVKKTDQSPRVPPPVTLLTPNSEEPLSVVKGASMGREGQIEAPRPIEGADKEIPQPLTAGGALAGSSASPAPVPALVHGHPVTLAESVPPEVEQKVEMEMFPDSILAEPAEMDLKDESEAKILHMQIAWNSVRINRAREKIGKLEAEEARLDPERRGVPLPESASHDVWLRFIELQAELRAMRVTSSWLIEELDSNVTAVLKEHTEKMNQAEQLRKGISALEEQEKALQVSLEGTRQKSCNLQRILDDQARPTEPQSLKVAEVIDPLSWTSDELQKVVAERLVLEREVETLRERVGRLIGHQEAKKPTEVREEQNEDTLMLIVVGLVERLEMERREFQEEQSKRVAAIEGFQKEIEDAERSLLYNTRKWKQINGNIDHLQELLNEEQKKLQTLEREVALKKAREETLARETREKEVARREAAEATNARDEKKQKLEEVRLKRLERLAPAKRDS